ncbi:MAG: ABC transporter permease, partial [Acidimicrobiia bacterium]
VLADAWSYLTSSGSELGEIVLLTLLVALSATAIGCAIGIPIGVWLSEARFRGRSLVMLGVNVGMGIPPVLAGLFVLILLWSEGPLGWLDLVFTPAAMVGVQAILALPIAIGVSAAAVANLGWSAKEQVRALDVTGPSRISLLAREARPGVLAAIAAAFGRVVSEVGAVLIVGGNIAGETRVLTTAIVQESRQARFGAAVALGVVLLLISIIVNGGITWLQGWGSAHD